MNWLRIRGRTAVALVVALSVGGAISARAHDSDGHVAGHEGGNGKAAPVQNDASAVVKLQDLELLNEKGEAVRFVTDALENRIVAIDFVYTTCTTACPVLSSVFSLVQAELGDRAGKEAWLVSMSIDPVRDTPRRMAEYGRKFDAGEGWIWLTGEKSNVDRVLAGLGAYTPEIVDHPPMVLIGDAKRGVWRRLFGFPAPEEILAHIDALAAERAASH